MVEEQRVARAEAQRALRVLEALRGRPGPGQRPSERVGAAHAGRGGVAAPGQLDRARRAAVIGLDDRHLGVDVHAAAPQQPLLHLHQREVLARGGAAPGGQLGLGEPDDVLGHAAGA